MMSFELFIRFVLFYYRYDIEGLAAVVAHPQVWHDEYRAWKGELRGMGPLTDATCVVTTSIARAFERGEISAEELERLYREVIVVHAGGRDPFPGLEGKPAFPVVRRLLSRAQPRVA
jgi:hypothetical protein